MPSPLNSATQPAMTTIRPAAGPLIVSSLFVSNGVTNPPTMAVKTPAIGGYPQASEIPRHRGRAIRKTRKPDRISARANSKKPVIFPRGTESSFSLDDINNALPTYSNKTTTSAGSALLYEKTMRITCRTENLRHP